MLLIQPLFCVCHLTAHHLTAHHLTAHHLTVSLPILLYSRVSVLLVVDVEFLHTQAEYSSAES